LVITSLCPEKRISRRSFFHRSPERIFDLLTILDDVEFTAFLTEFLFSSLFFFSIENCLVGK
jgi:hypothetical protein